MHIEAGIIEPTKMVLSYATAGAAILYTLKESYHHLKNNGTISLAAKSLLATLIVFISFEVLPHTPVGISEVHFIFGSTLILLFGFAPGAIGLALGLSIQSFLLAPFDIPQIGANLTTLLVPFMLISFAANKIISEGTAYKDVKYMQAFQLSTIYQAGIVAWVAFWAFYGQGFGAENLQNVATFGVAYMSVILIEPVLDVAILAIVKNVDALKNTTFFQKRLFNA